MPLQSTVSSQSPHIRCHAALVLADWHKGLHVTISHAPSYPQAMAASAACSLNHRAAMQSGQATTPHSL